MRYLRMTVGTWRIDLFSEEAKHIFARIRTEGVEVFRAQPGFISYRLMRADAATTVAVAEWETRDLGEAGAREFRRWLAESGIAGKLGLDTRDGDIVAAS
jgi:heme-degrading monooxygenase HmoA